MSAKRLDQNRPTGSTLTVALDLVAPLALPTPDALGRAVAALGSG